MTTTSGDHPLGTPGVDTAPDIDLGSIVDTILNLDQLLSADVRRAKRTASFYARADLESTIDELEAQLDSVTDTQGNPISGVEDDDSLGGAGEHPAVVLARRITEVRREYAASRIGVEVEQMTGTDWEAFQELHREVLEGEQPYANSMWDDLVAKCTGSTIEKVQQLRAKFGHTQVDQIASAAWVVNTRSGVSVPKSPLSSVVLKRAPRSQSST